MPSAWTQGFGAFGRGQKRTDNPHEKGTKEFELWDAGWKDHADHQRAKEAALDSIGWFG